MDMDTERKWDAASRTLDLMSFAEDRRIGPHKRRLFSKMRGATLMVAAGTGNDFKFFPPNMHVVAIDRETGHWRGPKNVIVIHKKAKFS